MDSYSRPASEYGINAKAQQKRSVFSERKTTPSPKIVRESQAKQSLADLDSLSVTALDEAISKFREKIA